jgi:MFS family permease
MRLCGLLGLFFAIYELDAGNYLWDQLEALEPAIFGHFGDRIGRKKTLVTTLLMTGLATFAVGLVPTSGAPFS